MRILRRSALMGLVFALLFMVASASHAGNPIRKLGRGIANVAFGALEIPMKVYDTNCEEGGIAAVTYGLFKGIAFFLAREGVGIVDIVTFPAPIPGAMDDPNEEGWGYGPLMRPEWVVDQEHNLFNIIYQDSPMMQ